MSRTAKSVKNVSATLFFQVVACIVAFFTRKAFVAVLTKDYLGLAGTFGDILSMLSLAELGVGTAIIYSLYKPLAEGDHHRLTAIMDLYRRLYNIIGIAVAVVGASLTPFLPYLIRDLPHIPYLNLIYLLFVLNSALGYLSAYKQTLIIADQRQYVVTGWRNGLDIVMYAAQAVFLWVTHEYFVYLGIQIGTTVAKNLVLTRYANQHYPYLLAKDRPALDGQTRQEIIRNVKALSLHKVGGVVVNGTDNLLMAYFIGLGTVGVYSNYLMLINAVKTLYNYLLRAVTASVGDFCVAENTESVLAVFWNVQFSFDWMIGFSSVCLAVLLNPFIDLWVGSAYLFTQDVTLVITINFYVWGMRKSVLMFWDTYGLYWHGRFKPIAEALLNLAVSILLAPRLGVAGILIGTIISTLITSFWVEPTVLFKQSFHASSLSYFKDYAVNSCVTAIAFLLTSWACTFVPAEGLGWFIVRVVLCLLVSNAAFAVFYWRRREFRFFLELFRSLLRLQRQRH
ncbi:MAG: hypothetical protein HDQ87_04920 [Clostridia bacterium]|nr:hypothetical protein [Clostridia bacterium]